MPIDPGELFDALPIGDEVLVENQFIVPVNSSSTLYTAYAGEKSKEM